MTSIDRPMFRRVSRRALAAFCAVAAVAAAPPAVQAQASGAQTLRPLLWQPGMQRSDLGEVNVFRRFPADLDAKVREFYHDVLGLEVLPSTAAGGGMMIRYPVGLSEVKLFPTKDFAANTVLPGSAVGVRVLTFFYADQAAISQRFTKHGIEAPFFRKSSSRPGETATALAQDPAGEWVELAIVPNASTEQLARFEIGVASADLAKSREFYRDLLGLAEHAGVQDELLGTTRYAYTHGSTTINVFAAVPSAVKRAAGAGMQYITWSAVKVDEVAKARQAEIDRPLSNPGPMRTIWLLDPDGVSNYFAEAASNDNTPPKN
jgi:catechol 2,3-dioxygenase-like lactoylglutathione lyase family enzyme